MEKFMSTHNPVRALSHAQKQKHLSQLETTLRLLNSYDWKKDGYADKYEWLREMYGDLPNPKLIQMFKDQFEKEALL
jgi:hypothetical protein